MSTTSLWTAIAAACLLSVAASGQTVTATIQSGNGPRAAVANPVTNKIYVANSIDNTVTVIDGASNSTLTLAVGSTPSALAVDPATNKIYVANSGDGTVTVLDGVTNSATTVSVGAKPIALALNPVTNKIYVANSGSNNLTVIDGASNGTTTVNTGTSPSALAINPVTNHIYVANSGGASVTDLDGGNLTTVTVAVAATPSSVAVNPVTNFVYVGNNSVNVLTVVDGSNDAATQVAVVSTPAAVAVNPATNSIYTTSRKSNAVLMVSGKDNHVRRLTTPAALTNGSASTGTLSVAIDATNNEIYLGYNDGTMLAINGATNASVYLSVGIDPVAIAINPVTNRIYVANNGSGNVSAIDGAAYSATTFGSSELIDIFSGPAVDPVAGKIYFSGAVLPNVGALVTIDEISRALTLQNLGPNAPIGPITVNPVTHKVYIAGVLPYYAGSQPVGVLAVDPSTGSSALMTVPEGLPENAAVNPITNKIYFTISCFENCVAGAGSILVVDGGTNSLTQITEPNALNPDAIAINPATNKIYVGNDGSWNLTIIDGANNSAATVSLPGFPYRPTPVIDLVTNKIYVAENSTGFGVIDGSTGTLLSFALLSGDCCLAVNPITDKIYAGTNNSVTIIDGATNRSLAVPGEGVPFAVDAITNRVYLSSNEVLDGVPDSFTFLPPAFPQGAFPPASMALAPLSDTAFEVPYYNISQIFAITEQETQPLPLTTTISHLPGDVTTSTTPSFTFTADSSYAPVAPAIQNVYYQVDTWQGPWSKANGAAPNFSGSIPTPLILGTHVLYAFATDGSDATSINTGSSSGTSSSPVIGRIAAYGFVVTPNAAGTSTAVGLGSSPNPSLPKQSVTFTAIVTASAGSVPPSGVVEFLDGSTFLGATALDETGVARFSISTLALGEHAITAVFEGNGSLDTSISAVLNQFVYSVASGANTTTSLAASVNGVQLTGPMFFAGFRQLVTLTASVASNGAPVTNGIVQFLEGEEILGQVALDATGLGSFTLSSPLKIGKHVFSAVFLGGTMNASSFTGSASAAITVNQTPRPH